MKNLLIPSLFSVFLLSSCGVADTSSTLAHAGETTPREASLRADFTVKPTNGGINPEFFAFVVQGYVMVGSNPCQARLVDHSTFEISERQTDLGTIIDVVPINHMKPIGNRACTREFNPVYKKVTAEVRGERSKVVDIKVANVMGGDEGPQAVSLLMRDTDEANIKETELTYVEVMPVNAGINPQARAIEIVGKVMIGTNECMALGVTGKFVTTNFGGFPLVTPVLEKSPDAAPRFCPAVYRPVFATISTTVRGHEGLEDRVIIENPYTFGARGRASEFIRIH